jgi:hypothetical protein
VIGILVDMGEHGPLTGFGRFDDEFGSAGEITVHVIEAIVTNLTGARMVVKHRCECSSIHGESSKSFDHMLGQLCDVIPMDGTIVNTDSDVIQAIDYMDRDLGSIEEEPDDALNIVQFDRSRKMRLKRQMRQRIVK